MSKYSMILVTNHQRSSSSFHRLKNLTSQSSESLMKNLKKAERLRKKSKPSPRKFHWWPKRKCSTSSAMPRSRMSSQLKITSHSLVKQLIRLAKLLKAISMLLRRAKISTCSMSQLSQVFPTMSSFARLLTSSLRTLATNSLSKSVVSNLNRSLCMTRPLRNYQQLIYLRKRSLSLIEQKAQSS